MLSTIRQMAIETLLEGAGVVCKTGVELGLIDWERLTTKPTAERLDEICDLFEKLDVLIQEQTKAPAIKDSLKTLKKEGVEGLSDFHKGLVRLWNESLDEAEKLPVEFIKERSKLIVRSNSAWGKARAENDFKQFEPFLAKMFISAKKGANYINPEKSPLDVLITTGAKNISYSVKELDEIFGKLKSDLVPLAKQISEKATVNKEMLKKPVDSQQLQNFAMEIAEGMGIDLSRTKIGKTEHSFMSGLDSPKEIGVAISQPNTKTITVEDCIDILSSFTHELGHGLVEQGGADQLYRTGLTGATLGIHESQSRLWENMVGRSKAFWQYYFPKLQQKVDGFKDINFDDFYNAVNFVEQSLIRTQSDEVTYNLHIMLRHELEKELLNPELSDAEVEKLVGKLPEAWNNKMEEYLGIRPDSDSKGVLQDVHWSENLIGYFPSYAIGNLTAAQVMNTAKKEIPDLEAKIARGDLKTLQAWLKDKIYQYGQTYTPDETIKRVTGEALNPKYFIEYLKAKYLD